MPYRFRHLLPSDLDDERLEALERLAMERSRSVEEIISDALERYLFRETNSER